MTASSIASGENFSLLSGNVDDDGGSQHLLPVLNVYFIPLVSAYLLKNRRHVKPPQDYILPVVEATDAGGYNTAHIMRHQSGSTCVSRAAFGPDRSAHDELGYARAAEDVAAAVTRADDDDIDDARHRRRVGNLSGCLN